MSHETTKKGEDLSTTTEIPRADREQFGWPNITEMIDKNANVTNILKKVDDKIDALMGNGTIMNLMNTMHRLNKIVKPSDFENENKEITSRYMNIFSSTLNHKYRTAWTNISHLQRKNASMEIIIQLNNLIGQNFCLSNKIKTLDLNPNNQTKFKNQLKTRNILLEAFKLDADYLDTKFEFPNAITLNLGNVFGKNLIYFPNGLKLEELDLYNPELGCLEGSKSGNNLATGVIYKNLAEYLHYNRSTDFKLIDELIFESSIDEDFDFNSEDLNPNSTNYSVRTNDRSNDHNDYNNHIVNSELIAFTFNNIMKKSIQLNRPVRVFMEHLNLKQRLDKLKCVFWNFTTEQWSEAGCRLIDNNRFYSICECDHLTNFAILMDTTGREAEANPVKSALTMFCVILSIIGLLITIIVFTFIPKLKSKRNLITANLCLNLLIVNILVGFFLEIKNVLFCRFISIVLFYFLINSFCWMFIQGYFLYQMIVLVFSNVGYFRLKHMILYCNGSSLIWLAIVISIIGPQGFYNAESSYL